jgi:hypothetical protein
MAEVQAILAAVLGTVASFVELEVFIIRFAQGIDVRSVVYEAIVGLAT